MLKCHKKCEFFINIQKIVRILAITTIERAIVYESSKSMNRSSRRTRIINTKSQKYSNITQKVRFSKIYSKIVKQNVNNKKINKNVNKNGNKNDIRSNRSIRMNKFQVEEYKQ